MYPSQTTCTKGGYGSLLWYFIKNGFDKELFVIDVVAIARSRL